MTAGAPEPAAGDGNTAPATPGRIVAGGGCVEVARPVRPHAERYTMLSLLWVFPSFGALFILGRDADEWLRAPSVNAALSAVRMEDWVAAGLLALHLWLITRAVWWRRRETPRRVVATEPNPDHDLHKLR